MSAEVFVVAVDVGNSAVKLAVQQGDSVSDHAIHIDSPDWPVAVIDWANDQFGREPSQWRVASVQPSAANKLTTALVDRTSVAIEQITRHHVPIGLEVDHPDRLGIDRILAAFAARNRVGTPAVVVDAGSAVTIDWIDSRGHFCGGAILPGLRLQSAALAAGTEALSAIEWDADNEIRLPARNTSDAIHSGILSGIAATIDALVDRYRRELHLTHSEVAVVLTGGDAPVISPHLRQIHRWMPNLVCRGLLDLPRSGVAQTNEA